MSSLDGWDLERYRQLLRDRAGRLRLDPRVSVRFDESDLTQNTILNALNSAVPDDLDSEAKKLGWLAVIQDNMLKDLYRMQFTKKRDLNREKNFNQALSDSSMEASPVAVDLQDSPSVQVEHKEEAALASQALESLSPREREVVRRKTEGMTLDEIATELNLTPGETSAAYYRGLRALRDLLKGTPDDGSTT